ncbi:MAG: CDP-diacylglycerol--glycerol-3-phosphate 3-phosphatidyltransferase [Methylophilaceae bacterium]|nr:CDP-diacylglycerol--glycerol-3-phosphate 3-phosphatidyltransferase [Methylophilaceae bacterium]
MLWNIPNVLTLLRIVLIPVFVGIFYLPSDMASPHGMNLLAAFVFALAMLTDWLDGWLARRLQQTSAFGAFLDPVADKLMVTAALIVLVELERVGAIVALVIVGREIAISALREWMAAVGEGKRVAVALVGKFKTGFQMAAILFLLYHEPVGILDTHWIGTLLIYVAVFLTLLSMAFYVKAAWSRMTGRG